MLLAAVREGSATLFPIASFSDFSFRLSPHCEARFDRQDKALHDQPSWFHMHQRGGASGFIVVGEVRLVCLLLDLYERFACQQSRVASM